MTRRRLLTTLIAGTVLAGLSGCVDALNGRGAARINHLTMTDIPETHGDLPQESPYYHAADHR